MAECLAESSLRPAFQGEIARSIIVSIETYMSKRFNDIKPGRFVFSFIECGRGMSKRK